MMNHKIITLPMLVMSLCMILLPSCLGNKSRTFASLLDNAASQVQKKAVSESPPSEAFAPFHVRYPVFNALADGSKPHLTAIRNDGEKTTGFQLTHSTSSGQMQMQQGFSLPGLLFEATDFDYMTIGDQLYFVAKKHDTQAEFSERLLLKIIRWTDGFVLFEKELAQIKWGARFIRLAYLGNDHVLVIWSDLSSDFEEAHLYKQLISMNQPDKSFPTGFLFGKQISSIKSDPQFIYGTDGLYLQVWTGFRYGAFAYSGKRSVGIARLDGSGLISDYRLLSWPADEIEIFLTDKAMNFYFKAVRGQYYKINFRDLESHLSFSKDR